MALELGGVVPLVSRSRHPRRRRGLGTSSAHRYRDHGTWFQKHVEHADRDLRPRERCAIEDHTTGWHEYDDTVRWWKDPHAGGDVRRDTSTLDYRSIRAVGWHEYDAKVTHHHGKRVRRHMRQLRRINRQLDAAWIARDAATTELEREQAWARIVNLLDARREIERWRSDYRWIVVNYEPETDDS